VNERLKDGASGDSVAGQFLRSGLIISELGLAAILLIAAFLLIRSSFYLLQSNRGFESKNILTAQVWLPSANYSRPDQIANFYQHALENIRVLPGVKSAGAISFLPMTHMWDSVNFEIHDTVSTQVPLTCRYYVVTPGYFESAEIPLIRGRLFNEHDQGQANQTVLINQTMANRFWPGIDPIGKQIKLLFPKKSAPWQIASTNVLFTVTGIVRDVLETGFDEPTSPQIYLSYLQNPSALMNLVIRSDSNPTQLTREVQFAVKKVDPYQPLFNIETMDNVISNSFATLTIVATLLAIFACFGLLLGCFGIYSVISYAVSARTREIG